MPMQHRKHNPKHSNQIRITGGSLRGRKLSFQAADGLRPTPDSMRERLFNWLGQDLTGLDVLDLFAGSGALGFEAVSRCAARALLCDNNRQTVRQLHWRLSVQTVCAFLKPIESALMWCFWIRRLPGLPGRYSSPI